MRLVCSRAMPGEGCGLCIIGLGNVLCADDGLGVIALRLLAQRYTIPAGVNLVEGEMRGLGLLPALEQASAAILVDACCGAGGPGSLRRLAGPKLLRATADQAFVHGAGVAGLLDAARGLGRLPAQVVMLGVVPATLELGLGCSPAVEARLPRLLAGIANEAGRLGHRLPLRPGRLRPLEPSASCAARIVRGEPA